MKATLSLLLLALSLSVPRPGLSRALVASAQNQQAKDSRYYMQQAAKAYQDKNYAAYLENMLMAVSLRPNHPTLIYNLSGAYALTGNGTEALRQLTRVAEMGLIYAAEKDTDFDSIKNTEAFKAILEKFESNKAPVSHSTSAFTIHEKGLITESVAYDPLDKRFYVSSVHKRKIVSVGEDGVARDFASAAVGLWSVLGIKVDARRRHLWAASAALPQMMNYRAEDGGASAIFKFDLKTGQLIKKYLLPARSGKPHVLGDLVLNSSGDLFTTDSSSAAIYLIDHRRDELEPFLEGQPFASPQGLDFSADEKLLFMADYSRGLFAIDVRTKQLFSIGTAPNQTLLGIDGLYFHRGQLVAIQNGVNPQRLIRLSLSKDFRRVERLEVIEANNPLFDEVTLGVVVRDEFFYIANSQWGAVDDKGQLAPPEKLREPLILKTLL